LAKKICVVGGGVMGEALARGMIDSGLVKREEVGVSDIDEQRLTHLRKTLGVRTFTENREAVRDAETIIIAVKPDVAGMVLDELREAVTEDQLIISIAAGITIRYVAERLGGKGRVVRVMPNQPCQVGEGASVISPGPGASDADLEWAEKIFKSVGRAVVLDEKHLNAATALNGSGPAYIYLVIEALADGGVREGLPRSAALLLSAQTVLGAAKMVLETGRHPAQLRDMVATPGGTTMAALHSLERDKIRGALINAVSAAKKRADELTPR